MLPPHCSRRLLSEGRRLASSPHSEYLRQRPGGRSSSSFTVLSLLGRMRDRTLPCRAEARRGQSRWTEGTERSERDRTGREVARRRQAWTRRGPVPEWARPRPPSPRPGHRRAGRVLRDGPWQKSRSTSQPSREPYLGHCLSPPFKNGFRGQPYPQVERPGDNVGLELNPNKA